MTDTLGRYLLSEAIPAGYRPEGAFTKKDLYGNMLRLAKDDPDQYVKTIAEVKRLGDQFATLDGISVGLDDIAPLYKERDAIVRPALTAVKKAKTREERVKIISDTQDKLITHAKQHPGTMGMMARSGSRGSAMQLMRAVAAPAAASDEHDEIQPWLTVHSYAEGVRPSEFWATNREARMAAVKSNIDVTEPGDLSKILINNSADQVITEIDCGTRNGLMFSATDPQILDRYLAKTAGSVPADTLITPRVVSQFKKGRTASVVVRSPMTCEASTGVCQRCMGLDTKGKLNDIGINVGIRASQSLGEPLTQLALNAKHGVRISGAGAKEVGGLEGLRAILESPSSFKSKATLSPVAGKVERVESAPQGGHYVTVGGERYYIPRGLSPVVKPGDQVSAGDALSDGVPRPDEVVKYKGLGAGRNYVVDKLNGIYKDSGIHVDRRHFEVLAKSTLNHLRVEEIDDESAANTGLVRGDVIDYNKFRNIIADNIAEIPLAKAEGRYLGEAVLYHLAGTKITDRIIQDLKRAGVKKVKVTMNTPTVSPITAPASRNPLLNPDWLVRMGHRYLKQSLLEGAHKGQKSDVHGTHPIPGLVFSEEFGQGERGNY